MFRDVLGDGFTVDEKRRYDSRIFMFAPLTFLVFVFVVFVPRNLTRLCITLRMSNRVIEKWNVPKNVSVLRNKIEAFVVDVRCGSRAGIQSIFVDDNGPLSSPNSVQFRLPQGAALFFLWHHHPRPQ